MVEAKIVSTKVMLGFRKAWCLLVSLVLVSGVRILKNCTVLFTTYSVLYYFSLLQNYHILALLVLILMVP